MLMYKESYNSKLHMITFKRYLVRSKMIYRNLELISLRFIMLCFVFYQAKLEYILLKDLHFRQQIETE